MFYIMFREIKSHFEKLIDTKELCAERVQGHGEQRAYCIQRVRYNRRNQCDGCNSCNWKKARTRSMKIDFVDYVLGKAVNRKK